MQQKIEIKGVKYPVRRTMGALLHFKRETGVDISEMQQTLEHTAVLLYCLTRSASRADGIEFPYSLEEFADNVDMETMTSVLGGLDGSSGGDFPVNGKHRTGYIDDRRQLGTREGDEASGKTSGKKKSG